MVGWVTSNKVRTILYQKRGLLFPDCSVSIKTSSDPSCQLRKLMVELFILDPRDIDHLLVLSRRVLVSVNKWISSIFVEPVIFHQLSWVNIFYLFILNIKNIFALEAFELIKHVVNSLLMVCWSLQLACLLQILRVWVLAHLVICPWSVVESS